MRAQISLAVLLLVLGVSSAQSQYYGKDLGKLSELHHGVRGRVYAVDSRTLFIKDFHYDGEGPAAFFYVGNTKAPSTEGGLRVRDERGSTGVLRKYRGKDITLTLPEGKTLTNLRWFSVYCDEYSVNFGDVKIPRNVDYPRPQKIAALSGVHSVSSDPVVIVDAQTLLVPNFSYDGEAPDAKFWVGRGEKPSPQGIRIPDENGKVLPLRRYDRKTIVLTLPGDLTVFDIGHFGVWCEAFTVDFGHVRIPQLSNVPPSLKMLGVSPQSKLNCEVLHDELAFEVRWAVAGDSIVLQLVAKLEDGEYMAFGLSGDQSRSQMVGGDVAVAWVDKETLKGYAYDYYLDAKSQCAGVRGSCPDERLGEKTNSVRLLNAAMVNGYSIVTYQRPLKAADELDRAVATNGSQAVIWAIGPLNARNEVSYHSHFTKGDKIFEFGRPPAWNCPMPETEDQQEASSEDGDPNQGQYLTETSSDKDTGLVAISDHGAYSQSSVIRPNPVPTPKPASKVAPWVIPPIQCFEPEDGVFYAQMGPTGGKHGYPAITGHVGWGISWYINGLLIPEINVVRGRTYTFVTEGGSDPDVPAKFHPFYITDDPVGGYQHKSDKEKAAVKIFAGVRRSRSGEVIPTGVGRLCNWTPDEQGPEADEYPSFGAYQRTLTLVCEQGNPGIVSWTPDRNTPDTVYYQCFTHRYLGWKINVVDECDDRTAQESERVERISLPDDDVPISHGDLLEGEESIQVATKVKPDNNFILDQRSKVEKHINTKYFNDYNDDFPKFSNRGRPHVDDTLTGEVMFKTDPGKNNINMGPNQPEYELPFTNQQLHHVLDTMDSLESKMKEEMGHHPIYQHSTPPSPHDGNLDLQPERPVREDEELLIESGRLPSSMMLPPNQKPLTLQTFMRPNGKPTHANPVYRRPSPPEIKNRRPVNHKPMHGMPMRNPYLSNAPGPVPPFKKHLYKNGNNRLPINGYGRPMPGLPPPKNFPPVNIPKPLFNNHQQNGFNHQQKPAPHNAQNVVGKPILPPQQTLQLGQSNIIAAHVVKSQITLPSVNDHISEQSVPQTYFNKPGQIILGKPMENPVPLDQQMTQTKVQVVRVPPSSQDTFPSTTLRIRSDYEASTQSSDMKSSDFIGESTDNSALVQPAVNTGFKPDSIVIESGFKPIIREPLMANEDRITDYLHESANRRQDTDVNEDYEESPQPIANTYYNTEPLTQSFEPMFIPSPPDHILPVNETTKEVFPRNHAKEDRPQPVYIKSENGGNGLFSKQNLAKDIPSDMVMAADRVDAHYLPPDPKDQKKPPQKFAPEVTYTSYDGKTVSAATLTGISNSDGKNKLFSSKLSSNSDLLTKKPQFGPFTGELPPIIAEQLSVKPPTGISQNDKRVTHLKLVNTLLESRAEPQDSFEAQGSEIVENRTEVQKEEEQEEEGDSYEDEEPEDLDEEEEEESERRLRRDVQSTNYEHDDHAHENNTTINHDHSAHDHNSKEHSYSTGLPTFYHCWKTNLVVTFILIKFI